MATEAVLNDQISYGVFWRSEYNKEWKSFSPWFKSYDQAYDCLCKLMQNPACIESAIVERIETYDFVTKWEK